MVRKLVLFYILAILLTSTLGMPLKIPAAKASEGIYIRADGSIDPQTAPISSIDNSTYTFVDNIYNEIVVERSNITIDGNEYTLQGNDSGNGFSLEGASNLAIKNANIQGFYNGIALNSTSFVTISGNNFTRNKFAINVSNSLDTRIHQNWIQPGVEHVINPQAPMESFCFSQMIA